MPSRLRTVVLILLASLLSPALAQLPGELPDGTDVKGSSDHPLVQRFEGSSIRFMEKKPYGDLLLSLGLRESDTEGPTRIVEGQRTTLVYVLPADVSPVEALRGYQEELAKLGEVTVLFEGANAGSRAELGNWRDSFVSANYGDGTPERRWMHWNSDFRYAALQIKRPDGDLFASIYAGLFEGKGGVSGDVIPVGRTGVRLDIAEPKPRVQRMVTVSSAEMSSELAKNGRVALYGILFDTGRTELKPESQAAVAEIAKLMAADPKLRLLVAGHTDSVGSYESNRDLSQRRAKAVVDALTGSHGVAAARLLSHGASFAAPVASNGDEAGRAKNRRVELVSF